MDMNNFEKMWETEYICSRVKRVSEAVERGDYESAIDYLTMIQEKSKTVEKLIKGEMNNGI